MSNNRKAITAGELAFYAGLPRLAPKEHDNYWYIGYDRAKESVERQVQEEKMQAIWKKLGLDHEEVQKLKKFFNE